jgi:hypothetical protein
MNEPTDTTAPGLRDQMVRLGYSVHQRSSHGPGPAFDYDAPWKGQMETRHFKSEEEAWADAERRFLSEVDRARKVLAVVDAPALIGGREKVANAARRLQEQIDDFDRDVADELESEGERADLWDDIDVSVKDLRTVLSALAQPSEAGGLEALREKVARIIEPSAFEDETPHHQRVYRNMSLAEARADALAKADAIAALSSAKPGTVGGEIDASPIINAAEEYLRNALSPGTDDFAARAVPVQEHPAEEALLARWCRQRAMLERERGAMDDASRFDVLAALASNPALPPHGPAQGLGSGWRPASEQPEPGRRIIAPYNDGSGARLFYVHDGGVIDDGGDAFGLGYIAEQFDTWAYLPADVKLWCEVRGGDDAFTFPEPASPAQPAVVPGGEGER